MNFRSISLVGYDSARVDKVLILPHRESPPISPPPVFAEATTGRPVHLIGSLRGLPQKAKS